MQSTMNEYSRRIYTRHFELRKEASTIGLVFRIRDFLAHRRIVRIDTQSKFMIPLYTASNLFVGQHLKKQICCSHKKFQGGAGAKGFKNFIKVNIAVRDIKFTEFSIKNATTQKDSPDTALHCDEWFFNYAL